MIVKVLGPVAYDLALEAMRAFTAARDEQTSDEVWLCEHPPVYTQGVAGKDEHVLDAGGIAVVRSDRGGQVTYHGPGQVVAYPLVDLRRLESPVAQVTKFVRYGGPSLLQPLSAFRAAGHGQFGLPQLRVHALVVLDHDVDSFAVGLLDGREEPFDPTPEGLDIRGCVRLRPVEDFVDGLGGGP